MSSAQYVQPPGIVVLEEQAEPHEVLILATHSEGVFGQKVKERA